MSHNTNLARSKFLLNGAGDSPNNPIVVGLLLNFDIAFNGESSEFLATLNDSEIEFITVSELQKRFSIVSGVAPIGENILRVIFEDETVFEKTFFIANLPSNAIQIFDITSKAFVNNALNVRVGQQCGIRFFPSFFDEFGIKNFGGVKYVSIFDTGKSENVTKEDSEFCIPIYQKFIRNVQQIQLIKHVPNIVETHTITARFRAEIDDETFFDIQMTLQTNACLALPIIEPITE